MTILDTIVAHKKEEVALEKKQKPVDYWEEHPLFSRQCFSLKTGLSDPGKSGIIAEFKRASPSKGIFNAAAKVSEVVPAYTKAGVSAISVLTDERFFGGSIADLLTARERVDIPLLRKDFIVDKYQITQSKACGADIILLIAASLSSNQVQEYAAYAKSIGLNILLEVHNEEELIQNLFPEIDAIGVNNRNLKNFEVDITHSLDLVNSIPDHYLKISESGISIPNTIKMLRKAGFQGFLIGENFMKTENPAQAIKSFSEQLATIEEKKFYP